MSRTEETSFTLTAELPGFAKEDVEVRLQANNIELKAQKKSESEGKEKEGVHKSRSYGTPSASEPP